MAIALDGSTPAPVDNALSTSSTAVTASFSPPANSLVTVVVNISFTSSSGTTPAITVADSLSGSYTAGPAVYDTLYTYSGIFTRYYSAAPGSITVTATRSRTTQALYEVVTQVLTGAASSQSGAASGVAHNSSGTTTCDSSITTTTVGSRVVTGVSISGDYTFTPVGLTSTHTEYDSSGGTAAATGYYQTGTAGAVTLGWTITSPNTFAWASLEILPGSGTVPGSGALSGSGSMTPAKGAFAGAAGWSGSGTMTTPYGPWTVTALTGSGTMTATGATTGALASSSNLTGSGTFGALMGVTYPAAAALAGTGTMTAGYQSANLTGTGTMGGRYGLLAHAALSGTGSLGILQVLGGLVSATAGVSTPYAYPGTSQVAVAAPGSANWMYLGSIGAITALTYSYICPGGPDTMTCTVMVPASYRTQMFNPGWQVRITRGGHQVWDGVLDEPVPTASGWNLTAVGTGNLGTNYLAIYSGTWPVGQPDDAVNEAIARGLPWVNPGIGTPAGAWFGQAVDSGAQTITALLNLVCTRGALTWYVNSQPGGHPGDDLSVFPLPSAVNRLLVCTSPVPRTLGGDINTIWIRYEVSADTTDGSGNSVPAVYAVTSVQNAQSVAAHGVLETYVDLSDAGIMNAAAAAAVGNSVLQIYQRASFSGPFTASYGQLLNTGGVPIDPGTDQASNVVRLILTDFGYGGEIALNQPVTFTVGSYSWDDFAQVATLTPYQSVDASLTGLLSLANTVLTPIAAASS